MNTAPSDTTLIAAAMISTADETEPIVVRISAPVPEPCCTNQGALTKLPRIRSESATWAPLSTPVWTHSKITAEIPFATKSTVAASASGSIYVALGVLSSAITYETGRSVAGNSRSRRNRVRDAVAHFPETLGRTVEVRFLLSANISRQARAATVRANDALMLEAHDEAHTYRDIVFLNMTESFHLCAWKKVIATSDCPI